MDEAWQEFEVAAASDLGFTLPLFSLADSKSRCGRHEEALLVVQRIPNEGLKSGSRDYIMGLCLLRAGNLTDSIRHLEDSHQKGYEPGVSAALLSYAHGQIASNGSRQEARRWKKLALHAGLQVEEVVQGLIRGISS
jgi:hypothetical protein